jgi:two-component system, sensor histidine kinase
MNKSDSDDVFTELTQGSEELQEFLDRMREQFPAALFQLRAGNGRLLPPEFNLLQDAAGRAVPLLISPEEGIVRINDAGGNLHAVAVPQLSAILLIKLPDSSGIGFDNPALSGFISCCIDLALLKHEQRILKLENQQIQRQIKVLNQQHYKLIEDNYRQYRQLQDREKEYAQKLEKEIARQTSELRNANVRLEESSRLKNEFLANISHELRTPLNAIIGFSELLAETGLHGEQAEYNETILAAGSSLLALINDILDLSKIEAGRIDLEKEPFTVAEVVSRVTTLFGVPAREEGVVFAAIIDEQLPVQLLGDANRLQQILINLVGNATKFTSDGTVELRVDLAGEQDSEVLVRFTVKDTGIGIPVERQKAIFEKFIQADGSTTRKYGGTGLGLAICKQLVSLMRGEIRLDSIPGKGSTFAFTVPLFATPAAAMAGRHDVPLQQQGAHRTRQKATVLLVEDNQVNQRLASIMLRQQDCEVLVAADGIKALEILKRQSCDLILMDIQMPRLDGLAATRKIRELESSPAKEQYAGLRMKTAPIPIIGLTAHARKEDEQASREAGMNDFLSKPISRDKLGMTLGKHLAKLSILPWKEKDVRHLTPDRLKTN